MAQATSAQLARAATGDAELTTAQPKRKKPVKAKAVPPKPPPATRKAYCGTIYPPSTIHLPPKFVAAVQGLEANLGMPVWLLMQGSSEPASQIDEQLKRAFYSFRGSLVAGKPIAVIVDSPGGSAKSAFQIATLLRRHCGGFTAVIPRYAKSAATLFALGANSIILNTYAELGPLDAQLVDFEREHMSSALDEVQTLERLHAFAMDAIDQTMFLLSIRTKKKVDTILPHTLRFVSDMMRPMLEKVDVVHFTQMARILKVAEEYAVRLMQPQYTPEEAVRIARHLVERYPEHGFVIDAAEAQEMDLKITPPTVEQVALMDILESFGGRLTVIGQLKEVKNP